MIRGAILSLVPLAIAGFVHATPMDTELAGKLDVQSRYYFNNGDHQGQGYKSYHSFSLQPELYWQWNNSQDSVIFKPFYRHDHRDEERSHGDIRELLWTRVGNDWEFKAGIGKVYWGVTEFQHLVDTINQTDAVESFDGEEKLGQPMLNATFIRDWGVIDAFVLPGFRERNFAGTHGRLRAPFEVDEDLAEYESSQKQDHVDYALRWSNSIDVFDLGVHWFNGTNRTPELKLEERDGKFVAKPYYEQINQFGIDVQATIEEWLWKFEALSRNSKETTFTAIQAGFEYSFYGVADSDADLGILLEYGWSDDGVNGSSSFQNDLFAGARITFNNVESSELLIGGGYDLDYDSMSLLVEGSHRLSNHWKLVVDARWFNAKRVDDPSYPIRNDDYLQLSLEYYF